MSQEYRKMSIELSPSLSKSSASMFARSNHSKDYVRKNSKSISKIEMTFNLRQRYISAPLKIRSLILGKSRISLELSKT